MNKCLRFHRYIILLMILSLLVILLMPGCGKGTVLEEAKEETVVKEEEVVHEEGEEPPIVEIHPSFSFSIILFGYLMIVVMVMGFFWSFLFILTFT